MNREKPLLLISNDDGIAAKGLNELICTLKGIGEMLVMAPESPRSGYSMCFTTENAIHYETIRQEEDLTVCKCNGTPTDCTKLGLYVLAPRVPDLVIGGINHGDNSAVNVHYSGTMGVVKEGCLKGIPSVAYSLCNHHLDADFTPTLPYVRTITEKVLQHGLPRGICLNINFPDIPYYKGVKICRQTDGDWIKEFVPCVHPYRDHYFWVTGEYINFEPDAENTDHWAMDHGYVAVTPTSIDVTAYHFMEELKDWHL